MKKFVLPIFIGLIIVFGTIIAFLATPNQKEEKSNIITNSEKILYFYSDTCTYCIKQKPILKELEKEGVQFQYMDTGENPGYFATYDLGGTPSFIFNNEKLTGYQSKDTIRNLWEENK